MAGRGCLRPPVSSPCSTRRRWSPWGRCRWPAAGGRRERCPGCTTCRSSLNRQQAPKFSYKIFLKMRGKTQNLAASSSSCRRSLRAGTRAPSCSCSARCREGRWWARAQGQSRPPRDTCRGTACRPPRRQASPGRPARSLCWRPACPCVVRMKNNYLLFSRFTSVMITLPMCKV